MDQDCVYDFCGDLETRFRVKDKYAGQCINRDNQYRLSIILIHENILISKYYNSEVMNLTKCYGKLKGVFVQCTYILEFVGYSPAKNDQ